MDGQEYLREFLRHHFEDHIDSIRVISNITLEEIRMIGNVRNKSLGVRQCRRLFNAPVLSDEIGHLLWRRLRQGINTFDHVHERTQDEEASAMQYDAADEPSEPGVIRKVVNGEERYYVTASALANIFSQTEGPRLETSLDDTPRDRSNAAWLIPERTSERSGGC
jgi:hypothetical protein